ncbi:discoidin, CUB and LCCL domain-containing protein 1 isoform X2 [Lampris incognitus]|uniref:discoidin, CUB and LCCL domain-containing protein 1 isoform X2 n=1 Tax=Lampris incognitus TaxID=2546036 RepID=UPI0024B5A742|nr:discoidin, CUB and LCCL domain-containing protein 1 isoform X2 [Lampris incognitus]
MLTKPGYRKDTVKSLAARFWIVVCVCSLAVRGQEGNGCGHTVLGTDSGTLASQNYPGTYPMDSWCKWKLRVPHGQVIRLLFGDFDIESSHNCSNGSLVIMANNGVPSVGPLCGTLNASQKNVTVGSNEVMIIFKSGPHRSGRGFLLSYATDQYQDLISCLQRGSHFISQHFSVYCPAGCRNVTGDVWGSSEHGYRDTSVLCRSAVHAGVVSDSLGGRVSLTRGRSLTRYESTFANGILSKMGSLSEKKLLFSHECNRNLTISAFNASSFWGKTDSHGQRMYLNRRNMDSGDQLPLWTADNNDQNPWLELELTDKNTVAGIITTGSHEFYVESYSLRFSKDRKNWKVYKGALSKEKKVFEAHSDGHLSVLNSLFPPVVARFVRLQPLSWHGRASVQVQLRGCPVARITPRSRSPKSPPLKVNIGTESSDPVPTDGLVFVKDTSSSQPVIVGVGVVLGMITCVGCLLAGVWWKRRKKDEQMKNYSLAKAGCESLQGKSTPCSQTELISYPLERGVHDALPNSPLNDYAEPGMTATSTKMGSTFRPTPEEGYTTPFTFSHYDTPSNLPEYAEPLPPEPEYATPFTEQPLESHLPSPPVAVHDNTHGLPTPAPSAGARTPSSHAQYDCPSNRVLLNGYCTPSLHANGPRPVSVIYAKPQSSAVLLQQHTYEEPF